jgi:hypothetical protein
VNDYSPTNRETSSRRGQKPLRFVSFVEQLPRQTQLRAGADNKDPLVTATRRLVRATWLLGFVGCLSFGAAVLQWHVSRSADEKVADQVQLMRGQLDEMGRQSAAIERQSTVGRAYVFMDYPPNRPEVSIAGTPPVVRVPIKFDLVNMGDNNHSSQCICILA